MSKTVAICKESRNLEARSPHWPCHRGQSDLQGLRWPSRVRERIPHLLGTPSFAVLMGSLKLFPGPQCSKFALGPYGIQSHFPTPPTHTSPCLVLMVSEVWAPGSHCPLFTGEVPPGSHAAPACPCALDAAIQCGNVAMGSASPVSLGTTPFLHVFRIKIETCERDSPQGHPPCST